MTPARPTLLLSHRRTGDSLAVEDVAREQGWTVLRARDWRDCPRTSARAPVAVYGEPYFADWVTRREGRTLLRPPPDWLCGLPGRYRRRLIRRATLSGVRHESGPLFVKDAVLDRIPSRVYPSGAHLPGRNGMEDLPVLVSEPVCWDVEFRFFVLERVVTTFAPSLCGGRVPAEAAAPRFRSLGDVAEALRFMEGLLADPDVALPPAVVVDVGRIVGSGWAVVEANPAWSSALYSCNPVRVVPVLARACIPSQGLSEADRLWVADSPEWGLIP